MYRARRAFLGVGLFVGFYLTAFVVALALLAMPFAAGRALHAANGWMAGLFGWHQSPVRQSFERITDIVLFSACFLAAGRLLWAVIPRPSRFEEPGPKLDETSLPDLFAVIRGVAAATRQPMPRDIYLLNSVGAYVTYRGGVMVSGSRRVLCVGLPLMLGLSVAEFKSVLAHEFGHYAGGDLTVGAWMHKTRWTIMRVWRSLDQSIFSGLVAVYWRMWLRLTREASRQQEFLADALSARVVHPRVTASALRRSVRLAPAFDSYWQREVMPVLDAGCLPPIAAGFVEFLADPGVSASLDELAAAAEAPAPADPDDTHPPVPDRLAALERMAFDEEPPARGASAAGLLGDPDFHARRLVAVMVGSDASKRLRRVDWDHVAADVYPGLWRAGTRHRAAFLGRYTADTIPTGREAFVAAGRALMASPIADAELCLDRAHSAFSAAIAVLLLDAGATPETRPGRPVVLRRGALSMEPFSVVDALARGALDPQAWHAQCRAFGIFGRSLGAPHAAGRVA